MKSSHLISEDPDSTRRGHLIRAKPDCRQSWRYSKDEDLRHCRDHLTDKAQPETIFIHGSTLDPGSDHCPAGAYEYSPSQTLLINRYLPLMQTQGQTPNVNTIKGQLLTCRSRYQDAGNIRGI